MENSFFRVLKGDRVIWMIFIFLFFVSLIEMFSASSYLVSRSGSISGPILRHVMFFVVGFIGLIITMTVPFKYIRMLGYVGLLLSWILLLYTLAFGVEQAGAARFLRIGGIQFQPSELARISLMIVIADFVYRYNIVEQKKLFFWIYAGFIGITCALIFPENFSTSALLFTVCTLMMYIGCVDLKYLLTLWGIILAVVAIIMIIILYVPQELFADSVVFDFFERVYTWEARIRNFIGGDEVSKFVINDSNYQVAHAQIAVARGGIIGQFPGNSIQRNFLPEAYSDFIYAIIVEELGFAGGLFVIVLYLSLLFRAGIIAKRSRSLFTAVLVIGVTLMIVSQAFIHMGVAVSLGPVTGQPLPLISRGGTSIVINCMYFGLILSVANQIKLENVAVEQNLNDITQIATTAVSTDDSNETIDVENIFVFQGEKDDENIEEEIIIEER